MPAVYRLKKALANGGHICFTVKHANAVSVNWISEEYGYDESRTVQIIALDTF